jgi:hypothetical protein
MSIGLNHFQIDDFFLVKHVEGRQLTPNGCLKSRQKLMELSTYMHASICCSKIFWNS